MAGNLAGSLINTKIQTGEKGRLKPEELCVCVWGGWGGGGGRCIEVIIVVVVAVVVV